MCLPMIQGKTIAFMLVRQSQLESDTIRVRRQCPHLDNNPDNGYKDFLIQGSVNREPIIRPLADYVAEAEQNNLGTLGQGDLA